MNVLSSSRWLSNMPRWIFLFGLSLWPSSSIAGDWSDYSLTIDTDYEIVHCNSLDVVLANSGGGVILMPRNYPGLGPICEYAVTPSHILTRHYGRTPRNKFAGDTFDNVDSSKTLFCITRKSDNHVFGPFSQSEFDARPEIRSGGRLAWTSLGNYSMTPMAVTTSSVIAAIFVFGCLAAAFVAAITFGVLAIRRLSRRTSASGDADH